MTWAAVRAGSVDPNLADSTLAPHQVRGHLPLHAGAKVSCCSLASKWVLALELLPLKLGQLHRPWPAADAFLLAPPELLGAIWDVFMQPGA